MRRLLPVLGSGTLVALCLWGILAAVERPLPAREDPWLEAWLGAGLKAQFVEAQSEPGKRLIFADGRDYFKRPDLAATRLRRYSVENVPAQVAEIPPGDSLPELPEGRHPGFRLRKKGGAIHACRSGRWLFLLSTDLRTSWFVPPIPVPGEAVERAFEAFERVAGRME